MTSIFLSVGLIVLVIVCGLLIFYVFRLNNSLNQKIHNLNEKCLVLQEENTDLSSLNREYERFLLGVTQVLEDDVDFLKGTLAKKLSLDIPEVQDLYRGLTRFKDDIDKIKSVMSEMEQTRNE